MSVHSQPRARFGAKSVAVAVLVAGALLAASPAAAHVHVDGDAVPGSRTTATFRVPTESDTAATTEVTVLLPTDTPITAVRALTKPGWVFRAERVELDTPVTTGDVTITSAYTAISWTATGDGIAPGEYDEFVVQLGPVPDQAQLVLRTEQGYSDGTTVTWDEVATGGSSPERPAPVLEIGEAGAPVDGLAVAALLIGSLGLVAGVGGLAMAARVIRRSREG